MLSKSRIMFNLLKYTFFLLLLGVISCNDEDVVPQLDHIPAPSDLSVLFTIASDNSGLVNIQPNGQGVTAYTILFGDGSEETAEINPGESAQHTYTEGTYSVTIQAMGINGRLTELVESLSVSFDAPENLEVSIVSVSGDPLSIDVSATADLETFFDVYFGDVTDEEPQPFMEGETVRHTYTEIGTYEVRVVARSGGAASTEYTEMVTISNPVLLPIDFESTSLNYVFTNFGGAEATVVDNPDVSEGNTSSRVGQLFKMDGAESWAGSFIELGDPIDFSTLTKIRMKTWAPEAGIQLILKLENLADGNIATEVQLQNSVANEWEEIIFDFSGADFSNEYQRIVLFFDFGNNGTDANYYFDDIELTDGSGDVAFPVDFESPNIIYTFTGFGGASAEVIPNPDQSGINTSIRSGSSTKASGGETWGGIFFDMTNPIDFTNQQKVRMKVWSPQVGAAVLLKFENLADGNIATELQVSTTVANEWEELEFDFTGIESSNDYQRVVLFFDFGNNGTGETYYFDDIQLVD